MGKLNAQADEIDLIAEEAEVVARHFRPRFEACFVDGRPVDTDLAVRLRPYASDRERDAMHWRRQARDLRDAAETIVQIVERMTR